VSAAGTAGERRWEALAEQAARHREGEAAVEERLQLLALELAGTPYALPVERVREIVRVRPVAPMPRVPREILGLISLRGEIVQVVDLRRRLGLPEAEPTRASRVVIVHGSEGRITGLVVDAVTEVLSVREDSLRPASSESTAVESLFVRGERFVSVLELDRVLSLDAA